MDGARVHSALPGRDGTRMALVLTGLLATRSVSRPQGATRGQCEQQAAPAGRGAAQPRVFLSVGVSLGARGLRQRLCGTVPTSEGSGGTETSHKQSGLQSPEGRPRSAIKPAVTCLGPGADDTAKRPRRGSSPGLKIRRHAPPAPGLQTLRQAGWRGAPGPRVPRPCAAGTLRSPQCDPPCWRRRPFPAWTQAAGRPSQTRSQAHLV